MVSIRNFSYFSMMHCSNGQSGINLKSIHSISWWRIFRAGRFDKVCIDMCTDWLVQLDWKLCLALIIWNEVFASGIIAAEYSLDVGVFASD
jgi:hypothetical protein